MADNDKTLDRPDSVAETTGFANPAVNVEEANLEVEVADLISAAVPPPAKIARE